VPPFSPSDLIQKIDLVSVLMATPIKVEIHDPTLEDYRDAEQRASLHLAPQAPDTKADEMRDLIIWAIALRLAKRDGGAILVSRDEIHVHDRGSAEANVAKLYRAKTFDETLDLVGAISPAGALAKSVLVTVWNELKSAGLPVPEEVPSGRFYSMSFAAGDEGHANTNLNFEFATDDGPFSGSAHIFQASPAIIQAELTGLQIGGQRWKNGKLSISLPGELPKITHPMGERISELRNIIEGSH
jgi:hypothetical protein